MKSYAKLPDAEFEVMKAVWESAPPVTAGVIMQSIGKDRQWKAQTAVTLLQRLVWRGFLRTEKVGKERLWYPLVDKDDYLRFETGDFMRRFHSGSFMNLMNALYEGETLTDEDIDSLLTWVRERRG